MLKQKIDFSKPLACVKYGRMSDLKQNPKSPDQQFGEIDLEIGHGGYPWRIIDTFRDDGVKGGYIRRRPEFFRMLTMIRSGQLKIDAILVDTAERFGRAEEIPGIRQELWNQYGVVVLTADSHFADPTTVAGKALTFVEQIRSTGGNEVKAHDVWRGKRAKALEKKWPGGPVPFGKKLLKTVRTDARGREVIDTELAGDPRTEPIVLKALGLALTTKHGAPRIAAALNADDHIPDKHKPFRADVVGYWLDNPIYAGVYRWAYKCTGIRNDTRVQQKNPDGAELIHGFCPPLITFEQWQEIQATRRKRGEAIRRGRQKDHDGKQIVALAAGMALKYPLSGLVFCGNCNARMVACSGTGESKNGTRYVYYRCPLYASSGVRGCSNRCYVRESRLRAAVIGRIRQRLLPPPACGEGQAPELPEWLVQLDAAVRAEYASLRAQTPDRRKPLAEEASDLRRQVQGLDESLKKPDLSPRLRTRYEEQVDRALERVEQIEREIVALSDLQFPPDAVPDVRSVLERLQRLHEVLAGGNVTDANAELSLHIQGIYCFANRRVEMRACKLGCLEGAIEMLSRDAGGKAGPAIDAAAPTTQLVASGGTSDPGDAAVADVAVASAAGTGAGYQVRSRRRSRLRTSGGAAGDAGGRAARALCPNRFTGLDARWFWIEDVDVHREPNWAQQYAREVWEAKRDHPDWSGKRLARAFPQVSRPTVMHALRLACTQWGESRLRLRPFRPDRCPRVCLIRAIRCPSRRLAAPPATTGFPNSRRAA